jgi:tetratricopeptide (TPR) repeat protein
MRFAVLGCFSVFLCGASAAQADVLDDCNQVRDPQLRLRACSEIIGGSGYAADVKSIAYRNRGSARADAGANAEALADFNQAVALRPDEAAGFAGRARTRLAVQDLDGAIADYGEALRLAPGTASSHIGRGHAHFVRGDTTAAIADFTEAIHLNPKSASTYNRRGLAYRRSGDLARAIDDYTTAIGLNPVYALAYNNRGYVYEAQGRKDYAISDFKSALLLDPSLIGARDGLIRLGATETLLAEVEARVREGKLLVEHNCSPCHAVGSAGESRNKKAPPFRSLHARHPSLALREPLSRGIAAPHDEMPRFALSSPEIDSIVAYINSLAPTKTGQWTTKTTANAQRTTSIADAVDVGDARRGLAYALKICSACHNVLGTEADSPNRQAPPFKKVANTPGMSVTALTVWSRTSHPTMPNLVIPPQDMDDLIAHILSLRDRELRRE